MMDVIRNFSRRLSPATATLYATIVAMGVLSPGALAGTSPPKTPWPADTPGTAHATFDFSAFAQPNEGPNTRIGTQTWGDNVNPRGPGDPTVQFYPDEWTMPEKEYWAPTSRGGKSARLDFTIPNYDLHEAYKELYVTIWAYTPGDPLRVQEMFGTIDGNAADVTATLVKEPKPQAGFLTSSDKDKGSFWYWEGWELTPNPDSEHFTLWVKEGSRLYQVDVDSRCYTPYTPAVPEPETYATFLAGLGLIGLAIGRRSRHRDCKAE